MKISVVLKSLCFAVWFNQGGGKRKIFFFYFTFLNVINLRVIHVLIVIRFQNKVRHLLNLEAGQATKKKHYCQTAPDDGFRPISSLRPPFSVFTFRWSESRCLYIMIKTWGEVLGFNSPWNEDFSSDTLLMTRLQRPNADFLLLIKIFKRWQTIDYGPFLHKSHR